MGCASSKLDDLPAVALCRDRCAFLDEAIRQRFLLAESHGSYLRSLKGVGDSLHRFVDQDYAARPLSSPELNLPPLRKGGNHAASGEEAAGSPKRMKGHVIAHSSSNSGSHINFHSDSDSDDDDDSISHLHHSDHSGEGDTDHVRSYYLDNDANEGLFPGGGGFLHMNFMKKTTTPSVVHQQRPVTSETVHFGESSSFPYNYPPPSDPYFGHPNYGNYGYPPGYGSSSPQTPAVSSSKPPPPPPPPSPPPASAWEFLNPFDSYDKFYPTYTPSRNLKDLREEEGIPDLEDEDFQHEVVKQVHGDQKYVDASNYSKSVMMDDPDGSVGVGGEPQASSHYETRPRVSVEDDGMEYEVHVVDKKVVDNDWSENRRGRPQSASRVAIEIKVQFERASEFGNEIAKLLEVGIVPYQCKYASKMLHGVPPLVSSQPPTSKSAGASSSTKKDLEVDEDLAIRSKNLSSTLQKLYLWERKLYNEVKAEEKMRVIHEKKSHKLKRLDERGAEANKVDTTRTLIRSLSTKIKMAIQVVDRISITINKIRDEELFPQLNELIEGLTRMWKNMLECHHIQCQAIRESKNLGHIGLGNKFSDAHLEATLQLERELLNWTSNFCSWIGAQKGYVRALNNWLVKCILYEPEETPDGVVPFSPGRMGAPPVFVICNRWAQAVDGISEKEVIRAIRIFAMSVLQIWEQDKMVMRQKMMTNKESDSKVRSLDREDQKIQKEIQALNKKLVQVAGDDNNPLVTGNLVYQSDMKNSSIQGSLQHIFEAMERFMADSVKAYEELLQHAEEERLAREQGSVS